MGGCGDMFSITVPMILDYVKGDGRPRDTLFDALLGSFNVLKDNFRREAGQRTSRAVAHER